MRKFGLTCLAALLLNVSAASAAERGYRLATHIGVASALAIAPVGPVVILIGSRFSYGEQQNLANALLYTGVGLTTVGIPTLLFSSIAAHHAIPRRRRGGFGGATLGIVGLGISATGGLIGIAGQDDIGAGIGGAILAIFGGGLTITGGLVQLVVNVNARNDWKEAKRARNSRAQIMMTPTLRGIQLAGRF